MPTFADMKMKYTVKNHGDWLEKQAADFIVENIPAYELIWQRFIGHDGHGKIAMMKKISNEDEQLRNNFSQHHYTMLESLYFMQLIVADVSRTQQIKSFDEYRSAINQIMAYQAYSGRLRDNMKQCFSLIASDKEAKRACDKLETFYHQRHVFIHGRKVPFAIDSDNLFKIAKIKRDTSAKVGFGLEMPWQSVSIEELTYMEDAIRTSTEELKSLVQSLLSQLLSFVAKFVSSRSLSLTPPAEQTYLDTSVSGSSPDLIIRPVRTISASGSVHY